MFNFETIQNSEVTLPRVKYLRLFYYVCAVVIPFYLIKNNIQYDFQNSNWVLIPLFLIFSAIPLFGRFFQDYFKVALISILIPSVILSILLFEAGGIQAPGILWIFAVPITFGIVLGRRGGLLGALYLIAVIVLFLILDILGFHGSIRFTEDSYRLERNVDVVTFAIYIIITVQYFINNEHAAREKLKVAGNEIENLLRVVVHDIATPVSVANLSLQTLQADQIPAEKKTMALKRLIRGIESIERILQQVRFLKSVRDGKTELVTTKINMGDCLESLLTVLSAKAEQKNIQFQVTHDGKPHWVEGDEVVIKNIIISNFITNAMKFSHKGSVIDIDYRGLDSQVVITIRDYGVGIPDDILAKVWSLESPTSRPGTGGEKGTGYGMPLAKEFALKMKGSIEVTSQTVATETTKTGTTVKVMLPKAK